MEDVVRTNVWERNVVGEQDVLLIGKLADINVVRTFFLFSLIAYLYREDLT